MLVARKQLGVLVSYQGYDCVVREWGTCSVIESMGELLGDCQHNQCWKGCCFTHFPSGTISYTFGTFQVSERFFAVLRCVSALAVNDASPSTNIPIILSLAP